MDVEPSPGPARTPTGSPGSRRDGREPRSSFIEPKALAAAVAHLAAAKKGADIRIYDVAEHIQIASYFVLVTGLSRPHVQAIANEVRQRLKELGERHSKAEGADLGWWVVLDYLDVVVHVMQPEAREFYQLDVLYSECPELDVKTLPSPETILRSSARVAQ